MATRFDRLRAKYPSLPDYGRASRQTEGKTERWVYIVGTAHLTYHVNINHNNEDQVMVSSILSFFMKQDMQSRTCNTRVATLLSFLTAGESVRVRSLDTYWSTFPRTVYETIRAKQIHLLSDEETAFVTRHIEEEPFEVELGPSREDMRTRVFVIRDSNA